MSFLKYQTNGTVFDHIAPILHQASAGVSQEQVNTLQSELINVKQQLAEQIELNKRLIKDVEILSLTRDDAYRLAALQEFLNLGVENDPNGKLSSGELSYKFMTWAFAEKGLLISDDETKSLMRKLFNIPKDQHSKFPYRGNNNEYFYKGYKWKVNMNSAQSASLPQVGGSMSPRYDGATSPAPVMTRQ